VKREKASRYTLKSYLKRLVNFIRKSKPASWVDTVDIPTSFVAEETAKALGGALVLLLDIWIQQKEKRKSLRITCEMEMKRLKISRKTYFKYQRTLIDLGFMKKEKGKTVVRYDPKKINIKFNNLENIEYKNDITFDKNFHLPPKGRNLNIFIP